MKELEGIVLRLVLTELARAGEPFVPVTSSNRHVHLCVADVERLFGPGYTLTRLRDLAQPGQYACRETVWLQTEKGKTKLRVVGPTRPETQVELSYTDCFQLGIQPALRMSGATAGTPGCMLVNGDRHVQLTHGVIVAERHLHMSPEEAAAYGLADGDVVALQVEGPRATRLENLIVRSGKGHSLEAHIDKDEANACGLADGQLCRVLYTGSGGQPALQAQAANLSFMPNHPAPVYKQQDSRGIRPSGGSLEASSPSPSFASPANPYLTDDPHKTKLMDLSREPHCLIAEDTVLSAFGNGCKIIRYGKDAVVTPLARDAALAKGIELLALES